MRLFIAVLLSMCFFAIPASAATIEAEPSIKIRATGLKPSQRYAVTTYVYRADNQPWVYDFSWDESTSSTPWGSFKTNVPLNELGETSFGTWPVYDVEPCILEAGTYNEVVCTRVYAGWLPESLWK